MRFLVSMNEDGLHADFRDLDRDEPLMGAKAPADACVPDFSMCRVPEWVWIR